MEFAETSNQTEDWCGATTNTNNAIPETLNDDRCAADTAAARPEFLPPEPSRLNARLVTSIAIGAALASAIVGVIVSLVR